MKLLLDEHYSPALTKELRSRGHNVVAAAESSELRGLRDEDLLRWARTEGRVVVTENVGDFMVLHGAYLGRSEVHAGIVFVSSHAFPRRAAALGRLVAALAAFMDDRGSEETLEGDITWL